MNNWVRGMEETSFCLYSDEYHMTRIQNPNSSIPHLIWLKHKQTIWSSSRHSIQRHTPFKFRHSNWIKTTMVLYISTMRISFPQSLYWIGSGIPAPGFKTVLLLLITTMANSSVVKKPHHNNGLGDKRHGGLTTTHLSILTFQVTSLVI